MWMLLQTLVDMDVYMDAYMDIYLAILTWCQLCLYLLFRFMKFPILPPFGPSSASTHDLFERTGGLWNWDSQPNSFPLVDIENVIFWWENSLFLWPFWIVIMKQIATGDLFLSVLTPRNLRANHMVLVNYVVSHCFFFNWWIPINPHVSWVSTHQTCFILGELHQSWSTSPGLDHVTKPLRCFTFFFRSKSRFPQLSALFSQFSWTYGSIATVWEGTAIILQIFSNIYPGPTSFQFRYGWIRD